MQYLDYTRFEQLDPRDYQAQSPFPWANVAGLLTAQAFNALHASLPDFSAFAASFGLRRKHGQQPHDRYTLEYNDNAPVAPVWREFIAELCATRYREHLCALLGVRKVALNFHWHFTLADCMISPHTDSVRKAGSHIFYFNTELDWSPEWGGQTLLLAPREGMPAQSAPSFDNFGDEIASDSIGNHSLLFSRTAHSWHGMRPLRCPKGAYRKVFIVVINHDRPQDRLRRWVSRNQAQLY